MQSYRDLVAWQRSMELVTEIYRVTHKFPSHEMYGLTNQLRRAAVSVPANLAEGHGRDSTAEFLHHISYSLGSLAEVETHLEIACNIGYLPATSLKALFPKIDEIGKIIRGLQRTLKTKVKRTAP